MQDLLAISVNFLFAHWAIAGCIMMGEQGVIPVRARRSLPSSLWGRLFLTWLNPGAGPGYLFVLLSFMGSAFTLVLAAWFLLPATKSNITIQLVLYVAVLSAYLALYMGTVRLICMVFLRRVMAGRLVASFTITCVLLILSVVATLSLSLASNRYQRLAFDWYCFPNLFWTLGELYPSNQNRWVLPECFFAVVCLAISSAVLGLINVALTAKDVVVLRIETPERVVRERSKIRSKKEEDDELEGLAAE